MTFEINVAALLDSAEWLGYQQRIELVVFRLYVTSELWRNAVVSKYTQWSTACDRNTRILLDQPAGM
jgi:hypothetical protein